MLILFPDYLTISQRMALTTSEGGKMIGGSEERPVVFKRWNLVSHS